MQTKWVQYHQFCRFPGSGDSGKNEHHTTKSILSYKDKRWKKVLSTQVSVALHLSLNIIILEPLESIYFPAKNLFHTQIDQAGIQN